MDNQLVFSTAQAVTATAASTNVIDMTVAQDLGVGDGVGSPKILGLVGTAFAGAGATLNVQFQGSPDNATWTTFAETGVMPVASLTAGQQIIGFNWPRRPFSNTALPRYIRLNYVVASGPFTAGTLTAAVVLQRDDADDTAVLYPSGFIVA
jgi:hypothetical protein